MKTNLLFVSLAFAVPVLAEPLPDALLDLSLEPPAINTSPGPQYQDAARTEGMIIGMDRTPKGRIWGCWVGNGDSANGWFSLATSDDDGATWSKPRLVIDPADPTNAPQRRALVGNLWTDPTGRLWLFFDQSLGYFDGRCGDWFITCDNPDSDEPVWSKPVRFADGCTLNKPTVLKNGEWLIPVALWTRDRIGPESLKEAHHELDPIRMANVFVSTDKGKTWTRRGGVAIPQTDFDEHMIVELRDGRLWMLARTKYGMAESFSSDQGRTWSDPQPSAIKNTNARFFIRRLASGKLLLVKNGPVNEKPKGRSHMSAFLSDDDGKTWSNGLLLDERTGVSYPDGFEAPDGMIHILYDRNRATDAEILMAKFREDDVIAGDFKSPGATAKLLVNKARFYESDPALAPVLVNKSPGPEYADDTRIFQGIPGIERAANGRLWALWYAGGSDEPGEGPGNYVVLVTSGDDGKTWSGPKLVIDPPGPVRAYDPTLWHDPQGRLWLFWAQSYKWWDGRSGVWAITTENSGDASPRWSGAHRLSDGIMMNKPTVLKSGEWLMPAAVWAGKPRADVEFAHDLGARSGANVMRSKDGGKSWPFLGQAIVPQRVFDEHMIVERRDGSLWMLVRAAYGIGESFSMDQGKTWSAGVQSEIPHVNARFFIRRLASGKLLLVTHNPPDKKTRSHLVAHLSDDDGKTWTGGLMIDERKGVSYPDGIEAPDGLIHIIYDYNRTTDREILMAKFREDDVMSGAFKSPGAQARMLVNKSTGTRPEKSATKKK